MLKGLLQFGHQGKAVRAVGVPRRLIIGQPTVSGVVRALRNKGAPDQGIGVGGVIRVDRRASVGGQRQLHAQIVQRCTDFLKGTNNGTGCFRNNICFHDKPEGGRLQ